MEEGGVRWGQTSHPHLYPPSLQNEANRAASLSLIISMGSKFTGEGVQSEFSGRDLGWHYIWYADQHKCGGFCPRASAGAFRGGHGGQRLRAPAGLGRE